MSTEKTAAEWEAQAAQMEAHKAAVPVTMAEATGTEKPKEERGFVQDVLVNGIVGGVEQAGRGVAETARAAAGAVGIETPELPAPIIDKPQGLTASITRDFTQFGLGFVGGMGLLKAAGVATKLAPVAKEMVASAIGTGVVADPNADRLSNLIQKYPALENPITEYLQQNGDDSVLESKFKSSLEDMATTPVALVLFKAVKGLKHAAKGDDTTVKQLADELQTDLAHASKTPDASTAGKAAQAEPPKNPAPGDVDLFRAMGEVDSTVKLADISTIKFGNAIDGPKGPASVEKYRKLLRENPDSIPAIVREELEDGSFYTPSGNHRLGAYIAEGRTQIPVVDFRSRETLAAKAAKEAAAKAEQTTITTPEGKPIFSLTKDEDKAFDAHVNYLVSNDKLEDVFNFPAFKAFNDARSSALPETKEMIDALALYVKPKLDKAMGGEVRTHKEVEKYADLLQEDPKTLYANLQQTFGAVQNLDATLTAARGLTQSLARETRRLATKIRFETATPEDREALALATQRFTDVLGMTQGIRKGAARATSAGKITTGEKDLASSIKEKDLDEIVNLLSMTKDEREAIGLMKSKSMLGKLIDAHNEIWINGILSGVKTHVVNMASATANTLLTPFNQIVGGALTRDAAEMREGFALYRGLSRHIFDSLEMASRAFKSEQAVLDIGKGTDETVQKAISGQNFEGLGRFADYLGTAARIPGRFLKAEDEFFKQMNYRAKVEAMSAREAADLVSAKKLDPTKMVKYTDGEKTIEISEVEKFMREKFQAAFNPAHAGTDKRAIDYSRENTFTQDLNAISTYDWFGNPGARIQQFASGHPWLRGAVLPFIKVPTNLMRSVGDLTPPLAMLKKEGMDILTGANKDPHEKAMFMGRLATGSMLWTGAAMMAMQGRITGAPFGDKEMRARQLESGWQPYSFVFENPDGTKTYVSYQRFDPFGTFFGLAADWGYMSNHVDTQSGHNWATMASLAVAKNISSKSYLQGLVEWSSMLGGGYTAEEQVKRIVEMRAASYIPNYMNLYTGNDELKEVRSVTDAMMAKIPGLSGSVEAKRDYFGEKRVAPMGYPWNAIDPFPVSGEKDSVRKELARLSRSQSEVRFEMPDTKLGNLDLTTIKNAQGQTAYDRWTELIGQVEIGGQTFHSRLESVIQSDRYKEGTDGTSVYHQGNRVVMLKNWQEKYREKARREMLKEFEDLRQDVKTDTFNKKAVRHGRVDEIREFLNTAN